MDGNESFATIPELISHTQKSHRRAKTERESGTLVWLEFGELFSVASFCQ